MVTTAPFILAPVKSFWDLIAPSKLLHTYIQNKMAYTAKDPRPPPPHGVFCT